MYPLKNFVFVIVLLSTTNSIAQTPVFSKLYKPGSKLYVHALQGLSLRDAADIKGKVLAVVKYGELVEVLADTKPKVPITNSNISGTWVKVKQGAYAGYMFDGFLSRLNIMKAEELSYDLAAYLKTQFKVIKESNKTTEADVLDYLKVNFLNGVVYENKGYEGGITTVVNFPITAITFQELYLLARESHAIFFDNNSCPYKAENMDCDYEDGMANLTLKRQGAFYVMEFNSAD